MDEEQYMGGDKDDLKKSIRESKSIMERSAEYGRNYPPDWDAAERHGMAKGVVKALQTQVDFEDEDSFCLCCLNPIPKEEDKFGCCDDNETFGEMGSIGFPLFFEFNN